MSSTDVIHRLNRIIGQLEAIKRSIETPEQDDCSKHSTVEMSVNGLKNLGNITLKNI